jgi:hypothetical protein
MSLEEAIRILTVHQVWRVGADIPMISPKELTEAIDVIINYYKNTPQVVDKLGNEDVPKLGYLDELAEEHITKHHLNHSYNTSKFSFKEGYKKAKTK